MKPANSFCTVALCSVLFAGNVFAVSLTDTLSSAASQLNGTQQGGTSLSSVTSLLNGSSKALSADSMNNAAGILQYCVKQKVSSVTSTENIKNQLLNKLGLNSATEQQQDTSYMDGLKGLLNARNGQQLDLTALGNTEAGKKVKAKVCDLVLKQSVRFATSV